jgi:1,4-dihydroxy-2-naphthoate polyprenyltransferase
MSRLRTWWLATRPFAFPASIMPALLGGGVAVAHAGVHLHWSRLVLAALGAALVHAASNLLNDYFDYRAGVDTAETQGASRGMLVSGRIAPRDVLVGSVALWAVAGLIALFFVFTVGRVLLPLIAGGLLLGAGYTAAPLRLKYRALGDICVFLAFGVGITLGAYAVQTGRLAWTPVFYSLPLGLLIWAIVHSNNLRDIATDRLARIRTLAMALGPHGARVLYTTLIALAYLCPPLFVIAGVYKPATLATWLSLPLALGVVRAAWRAAPGGGAADGGLVTLDIRTAQLQLAFGVLMLAGLVATVVFAPHAGP